jgi:hypothetical protein
MPREQTGISILLSWPVRAQYLAMTSVIVIFIIGYLFIVFESRVGLNKAATALLPLH